jgi:membrane-associated protein
MAATVFDWLFHLDTHLAALTAQHGAWVYLILAAVIFVETGLVVMPFLPGDSLLFVAGALAAGGALNLAILVMSLAAAAILGDAVNFSIGAYCAKRLGKDGKMRWIKPEHLQKTQQFFDRHGRKTIILARFVPVVRTLAPFVAALGRMPYRTFLLYNAAGGVLWVVLITGAGYLFGQVDWIQANLTAVLLGVVVISILPAMFEWWRARHAA